MVIFHSKFTKTSCSCPLLILSYLILCCLLQEFLLIWRYWSSLCNILFIFSKNQFLDLLILRIVLLVSMSFNSALILIISSLLLTLSFVVVVPLVLVDVGLRCLFEIFLSSLGRPVLLWLSLSELPSLHPTVSRLLCVHFHLFPDTFWFLPWSNF